MPTKPVWAADGEAPARLVVDGGPTGVPLWGARTRRSRSQGLLGTADSAVDLWIEKCPAIHTFGMRYPLRVAFVDKHGAIVAIKTYRRNRLGAYHWQAAHAVEFPLPLGEQLPLRPGTKLEIGPDA
ncbi:DUF192 domain-containing protein [Buchananella hordeovulneris]|uniref:DUF192 domain-containing protein n=1 Tax=Buchananella hordeovulneris TaxID=52770 RepID=UPI00163A2C82|nr:DUF192 domain-containing protein [Buchananella hordeovulneris]